ncbi:MAG: membrane dipeptidase, partial [Bryobacteraceae bacterium]|nr:membrane dipeptidase [Bryobacteraceae bacterium]
HRTLQMIDTVKRDIAGRYPNDFELTATADGLVSTHKHGKIAALMGIEGGHAIEDDLRLLRRFHDLGIRYMTLTHTNDNNWGGSSGSQANKGLTEFGKQVVLEMNRLGMMVDISHVSDRTFYDALETSKAPIFASHSSCRAVSPVPRNMTDEMIAAMAKKGGVIQINFDCGYLNPDSAKVSSANMKQMMPMFTEMRQKYAGDPQGMRKAMREMRSSMPPVPKAKMADVVKHINHVVNIAGVDAVGLGSDFDGVMCLPEGLDSADKWPNLTRALLEEGYTAAEIRKIYGENLLRFMASVEKTAKQLI